MFLSNIEKTISQFKNKFKDLKKNVYVVLNISNTMNNTYDIDELHLHFNFS